MIQHTLVRKLGLVIYSFYNGYRLRGGPSLAYLWRGLRAAMCEIGADWDFSTPGPSEARDASDFSCFHGWSKPCIS
jgi:hypothetical protein